MRTKVSTTSKDKLAKNIEKRELFKQAVETAVKRFADLESFPGQYTYDLTLLIRTSLDDAGLTIVCKRGV